MFTLRLLGAQCTCISLFQTVCSHFRSHRLVMLSKTVGIKKEERFIRQAYAIALCNIPALDFLCMWTFEMKIILQNCKNTWDVCRIEHRKTAHKYYLIDVEFSIKKANESSCKVPMSYDDIGAWCMVSIPIYFLLLDPSF